MGHDSSDETGAERNPFASDASEGSQPSRSRRLLGYVLLLAAVLLSPWLFREALAGQPGRVLWIVLFQLLLLHVGLLLPLTSVRSRLTALVLAMLLALVTVFGLPRGTSTPTAPVIAAGGPSGVLSRVLGYQERQSATLLRTTAPLLYQLDTREQRVEVEVPAGAALDTAFGIDPELPNLFRGEVHFEIAVIDAEGEATRLLRQSYDVPGEATTRGGWWTVSVDLAEYEGQSVTLVFRRLFNSDEATASQLPFDLEPSDLMLWSQPRVRAAAAEAPNVLLISIDTLRADRLGVAGARRDATPSLDQLAADGAFFSRAYAQAPWTSPSHLSIFTGLVPSRHGGVAPQHDLRRRWPASQVSSGQVGSDQVGSDQVGSGQVRVPTMAEIFRAHGYRTAAFTGGAALSAQFGFAAGFDAYHEAVADEADSDLAQTFGRAASWVRQNGDRPFFLFVHTYEPHWPYRDGHFVEIEGEASTEADRWLQRYDGDVRLADAAVGNLVALLRDEQLLEHTLIVVTSDHGEEFGEREYLLPNWKNHRHGHSLFDEVLRVPLILHGFPGVTAGARSDDLVRSVDILPTVLAAAGVTIPEGLDGANLLPLLGDEAPALPRPVVVEATTFGPERDALRTERFKLVRRLSYGELRHPVSDGFPLTPLRELYDLEEDPQELRNLAAERPEQVRELEEQLEQLLPDVVPAPGSAATSVDAELQRQLRSLGYLQ